MMAKALIYYHLFSAILSLTVLYLMYQGRKTRTGRRFILLGVLQVCLLISAAIFYPLSGFGRIQLLAWGVFLYFPIFLAGSLVMFWKSHPALGAGSALLILTLIAFTAESFLIEPRWLQVTRIEVTTPEIEVSLKIAILADIQTDAPGPYEERVFRLTAAEHPDLVLLAGDYLQIANPDLYQEAANDLNRIIRNSGLAPDLGIYAVRGNVDWNLWEEIFRDLEITLINDTEIVDLGSVQLTGLGWHDSENPELQIRGSEKYHIVLGHSPDYSLGEIDADLLLAGHTHGGQVQLPGIGPLLTLSSVPREWASGLTEIEPGKILLVSRGIGMERGDAPRMRFLCRPEIIILTLAPEL